MKKILFFALALAFFVSCSESEEITSIDKDVTCSVGFSLTAKSSSGRLLSSQMNKSSQEGNTNDPDFLDRLKDFKIENYHSFSSFNPIEMQVENTLYFRNHSDEGIEMSDSNTSKFSIDGVKLGYNTFVAEATQNYDYATSNWFKCFTGYKTRNVGEVVPFYKHYVGVTRTVTNVEDFASTGDAFVPQMGNWPWKYHSTTDLDEICSVNGNIFNVKNKVFNIEVGDVDASSKKYNKTVVLEMSPENSVIDIKAENKHSNYWMAVSSQYVEGHQYRYKNAIVMPNTPEKRYVLNNEILTAGRSIHTKLYVLEPKVSFAQMPIVATGGMFRGKMVATLTDTPENRRIIYLIANNSTKLVNYPAYTDTRVITNLTICLEDFYFDNAYLRDLLFTTFNKGNGQTLLNATIKGNQHYKNEASIVLNPDSFSVGSGMLIMYNTALEENPIIWRGW